MSWWGGLPEALRPGILNLECMFEATCVNTRGPVWATCRSQEACAVLPCLLLSGHTAWHTDLTVRRFGPVWTGLPGLGPPLNLELDFGSGSAPMLNFGLDLGPVH